MKPGLAVRASFFLGVFLVTGGTLALQIVQTRILSVMTWYYMAFLSVSLAMLGLASGGIWVYRKRQTARPEQFAHDIVNFSLALAVSVVIAARVETLINPLSGFKVSALSGWLTLIICLALPFFFSGVLVSLFLTRSPFRVGRVYGVDMVGAAAGCYAALLLLDFAGGPPALVWIALVFAGSALLFAGYRAGLGGPWRGYLAPLVILTSLAVLAGLLQQGQVTLDVRYPKGYADAGRGRLLFDGWNSFSRIALYDIASGTPKLWGPGQAYAPEAYDVPQRMIQIDGLAGTFGYAFSDDWQELSFLRYDVSNLAYHLPGLRHGAVIGVGLGRDLLSAKLFGLDTVVGIELNPIISGILTERPEFKGFSRIDRIDGVSIAVDEARSWLARSREQFDIIEMSLIDTWAATGAGAYVLSENQLYTQEAWKIFLGRLQETGVFTVSRYYYPESADRTVRMLILAKTTLWAMGTDDPNLHLFLATSTPPYSAGAVDPVRVATLIVARQPLPAEAVKALQDACDRLGFMVLASPSSPSPDPRIAGVLAAATPKTLMEHLRKLPFDVSPPTDGRPFFFNQLSPFDLGRLVRLRNNPNVSRFIRGNVTAITTLLVLFAVSLAMVLAMILLPAWSSTQRVGRRLVASGTFYFLLIGAGFMFVEIGMLQLLSVFLGHPIYSLSVVLFALILSTGLGSFWVDRFAVGGLRGFLPPFLALSLYLLTLSAWLPSLLLHYEGLMLAWRVVISVAVIAPAGIIMGFALPTGMTLVARQDPQPTPWFWGVNGAAAVAAATLSVAISLAVDIYATLICGALCYAALGAAAAMIGFDGRPAQQAGAG